MDSIERDDFIYALQQTMAFWGKEIGKRDIGFWVDACRDKPVAKLKLALREHNKISTFAPRPANILSLVNTMSPQNRQAALPPPPKESNCPPEIAQAWMWFIDRCAEGSSMAGLFDSRSDIDIEQQEKYLHVVNHEAHKYDMPEAIPDEYKLQEVWA